MAAIASDPELGDAYWTVQLATPGELGVGVSPQVLPKLKTPPFPDENATFPVGVTSGGGEASATIAVQVSMLVAALRMQLTFVAVLRNGPTAFPSWPLLGACRPSPA